MPLLTKRKLIRLGIETDKGTAVATTAYLLVTEPKMIPDTEFIKRQHTDNFAGNSIIGAIGRRTSKTTFTCELLGNGSGAADPAVAMILQGCGFKLDITTWKPQTLSTNQKTLTIDLFDDGDLKRSSGCSGELKVNIEDGQPISLECEFSGYWHAPEATVLPTPSFSAQLPIIAGTGTFTLDSAMVISQMEVATNNTLAWRNNHYAISNRDITVSLDPEAQNVGDYDFYGKWTAGTTAAMSYVADNGTDKITIAAPKLQFTEIDAGDRDGLATYDINAQAVKNTGDDELTLTFAAAT